ncbi:ribose ABC transporter permease [Mesorhizobium sp. Root157]|uniref:ABC transporter permease n=1 Tax=Mesorhizobium sp. Root157 TaxID=1736477 RepID=UPI0006FD0EFA|nr:ribose ABC transporter permease [Mesorhizobium sp. Root157]KQZ78146.1 ribose ABC transporter permease [Mesorhizobium sp. Root157]
MSDISTMQPQSSMQKLSASVFKASGLLWVFLGLCVVAALLSPAFLNPANLMNVFRQVALYGIVSVGMTFVILTKGIDLSVGSILGVCAVSAALLLTGGWSPWLAVVVVLLIGAGLGAVNGIGVAVGRVPPFIMTLGMMVMARGLALTLANGQPIGLKEAAASFAWLGRGAMLGVPVPVWIFAVVAAIAIFVLRYTPFGRQIYAVGSNEEAAHLSGISVNLVNFYVYVISGFLAALTALIFVSRLTVGEPTAGTGIELEAIAITVIGGTSLFGGEGGIFGTIIGAAILAVLANIMNLVGISPFTQQIVKGAIIVGAVLYEMQRKRK